MHLFILVILSILLISPSVGFANNSSNALNKPAPNFSLSDIDRKRRNLNEWKGKLIILNFWATWCVPCKTEIPILNEVQKTYASEGLQVIGIAVDHWAAVKQFNHLIPIEYVNLIGNIDATLLVKRYGNRTGALPYTVVINPDGRIVSIASGQLTEQYLKQVIEKNL